ncbi:MAG: CheR family methyltransferase [Terriglobales bacterium]
MSEDLSLRELIHSVAEERGLDLRGYKPSSLERRTRKRMFQLGIGNFSAYLQYIRNRPGEINELLNTVLINVTEFFRDPLAWEVLRSQVLPRMLKRLQPGDSFRAWSAGCASGEEPYSLAILLADHFGPHLSEYDIKIYATDIDEEALNVARRGEFPSDTVRRVRPEWRERYFTGATHPRINRDIRRLVIFGRSNLVSDAPISHCRLVICRNVLIYLDVATQCQVLMRLHYALEPEGVLFLGKAESKLSESQMFRPIDSRWRIFQKTEANAGQTTAGAGGMQAMAGNGGESQAEQELRALRLQYRTVLETLKSGVVVLDANDVVAAGNGVLATIWGLSAAPIEGKRIHNTELVARCPELPARLEASRSAEDVVSFHCRLRDGDEERFLLVVIRPVRSDKNEHLATIIHADDVTSQERLQSTVEQLEATTEELQSANEELETTNEELQSTNEELETTNEELQSTNEELETTNEELQSLNEELENMNEELEARTRDLDALTRRYAETLTRMPWPVMLIDREEKIQLWNKAAQRLFGVGETSVVGVAMDQLPMEEEFRKAVVRRCRWVLVNEKCTTLRDQEFHSASRREVFDLQFTPISQDLSTTDGVLIMFGPAQGPNSTPPPPRAERRSAEPPASRAANPAATSKSAAKPAPKPVVRRATKKRQSAEIGVGITRTHKASGRRVTSHKNSMRRK